MNLLDRSEMAGFWSKNRGFRTQKCGSFPRKLFFATREDLPSAHGERGKVCGFVWLVSIENEGIAIVQRQLGGFPFARCVLPPNFRWRICLIAPALVDRNIQGLHRLDIKGRIGRWRKRNDPFPKPVQAQEKFDLLRTNDCADVVHFAFAAGAPLRVFSPGLQDQIAPQRSQGTVAFRFRGGKDEEGLGLTYGLFTFFNIQLRGHQRRADRVFEVPSPPLVGVASVVANRLLAFRSAKRDRLSMGNLHG